MKLHTRFSNFSKAIVTNRSSETKGSVAYKILLKEQWWMAKYIKLDKNFDVFVNQGSWNS